VTWAQGLKEWETTLQKREMALQEREMALQEREAKMEELLAERSTGIDRVVRWVGEANPSLDALGLSPIQVAEAPPSLGVVLPVLDSAAERLRRMESTVLNRLETTVLLLPEPRPRHSTDSSLGWPRSSNGGHCTGRSARGGGYHGVPHRAPLRTWTCKEKGSLRTTRKIGVAPSFFFK
jgi:hypothetical protein